MEELPETLRSTTFFDLGINDIVTRLSQTRNFWAHGDNEDDYLKMYKDIGMYGANEVLDALNHTRYIIDYFILLELGIKKLDIEDDITRFLGRYQRIFNKIDKN